MYVGINTRVCNTATLNNVLFVQLMVLLCVFSKRAVGGRPPQYAPAQACNGSAQRQPWARTAESDRTWSVNTRDPAGFWVCLLCC